MSILSILPEITEIDSEENGVAPSIAELYRIAQPLANHIYYYFKMVLFYPGLALPVLI